MAAYGTARTYATQIGQGQIATLLETTLQEEEMTEELPIRIAGSNANDKEALQEPFDDSPDAWAAIDDPGVCL